MAFRRFIQRTLLAGSGLTLVVVVSACLWGLLGLVGDTAGAAAARGVTMAAAVGWGLAFVALVVLLALDRIGSKNE